MYYIAICDNDKTFIKSIKKIILRSGLKKEEVIFYEYSLGNEMIEKLQELEFCDLLILDIKIKEIDSYEIAKSFRKIFKDSILVFCSSTCAPTEECFKVTPYRYLYKDYTDKKMLVEMKEVIEKVKMSKDDNEIYVVGSYYYNIVKLMPSDILYIENSKHGSMIHICKEKIEYEFEKKLTTNCKLDELYRRLKRYGFEYGHNSYLINLRYVNKMLSKGEVKLSDGTILSISRSKLKRFRTALLDKLNNEN